MPTRPPRPCSYPGCRRLSHLGGSRCELHPYSAERDYRREDSDRGTAAQRGYNQRWRNARAAYLRRHPLCVKCDQPATVVDHITPHRGDMVLFWDVSNWQPLCKPCHDRKTARGE